LQSIISHFPITIDFDDGSLSDFGLHMNPSVGEAFICDTRRVCCSILEVTVLRKVWFFRQSSVEGAKWGDMVFPTTVPSRDAIMT
jgi:hypothetical protein